MVETKNSKWSWTKEKTVYRTLNGKKFIIYGKIDSLADIFLLDK